MVPNCATQHTALFSTAHVFGIISEYRKISHNSVIKDLFYQNCRPKPETLCKRSHWRYLSWVLKNSSEHLCYRTSCTTALNYAFLEAFRNFPTRCIDQSWRCLLYRAQSAMQYWYFTKTALYYNQFSEIISTAILRISLEGLILLVFKIFIA